MKVKERKGTRVSGGRIHQSNRYVGEEEKEFVTHLRLDHLRQRLNVPPVQRVAAAEALREGKRVRSLSHCDLPHPPIADLNVDKERGRDCRGARRPRRIQLQRNKLVRVSRHRAHRRRGGWTVCGVRLRPHHTGAKRAVVHCVRVAVFRRASRHALLLQPHVQYRCLTRAR